MQTTATNRKLREILTGIRDKKIIPNPDFQRRLVWTSKDKIKFLDTVLNGYPFPEIYIAAGEVDPMTGDGTEMLVDGQQRMSTLYQYFMGDSQLQLGKSIKPYGELTDEEKIRFLQYDVVVRDLGKLSIDEIRNIFARINATSYALNAMEIHNSRFDGEFKQFAEQVAQDSFFGDHNVFSAYEIRRMRDVSFALVFIITIMSTYFHREDELENYLSNYNDEFDAKADLQREIRGVFAFITACGFESQSRAWKQSDLFTLLIEIHRAIIKEGLKLDSQKVTERIKSFYAKVNNYVQLEQSALPSGELKDVGDYYKAASHATTDRGARIRRGEIIQRVISGS